VSPYATPSDLAEWTAFFGLEFPNDPERLLDLSSMDVARWLGVGWDPASPLLETEQRDALRDGACVQACYRIAQGHQELLGVDDGVSSLGSISFAQREVVRFSPEAAGLLSGMGLLVRSGCAEPDEA